MALLAGSSDLFPCNHLPEYAPLSPTRSQGLVDVLDRILDKGLVIAGDIKINLANVELLTVQVRLLVCSIDKAEEIGLNWWKFDPALSLSGSTHGLLAENRELRARIQQLEERLDRLGTGADAPQSRPPAD
ncbi:MAG TPA: gas vesicle protein [Longimicrobiaceae bacterium]